MSSMASQGPWTVLAALPEEVRPLKRRLRRVRPLRLPLGKAWRGELGDQEIVVAVTGDGGPLAARVATGLLEEIEARVVVVVGIAGGLSPDLAVGMVVVADRLTDAAGEVPAADSSLVARAADLAGARRGTIHSHSEIAIDPVAKSRLWSRVGRVMPAAVDLESASYARAAVARGVPYLVLRAISDGYDEALPLDFNRYRKPDGSSDRARVLRYTLRHPSIVPELMQLRERMRHCAGRLAALVEKVIAA